MKIIVAVNTEGWDGKDLISFLNMKGHEVIEATTSFVLLNILENQDYDIVIINQKLLGLENVENYISVIRDKIPVKSEKRAIFNIHYSIEKLRDELINEHFFDFLVGKFKAEELLDMIENPRSFDDVRQFQIRTVKRIIEKSGKDEIIRKEDVISTKVLPNKIVGFHGATATNTLLNIAIGLSQDKDLKIIVVDANPNAHLSLLFTYKKYTSIRCMSELIEHIRKDKLNKETIYQFLVQHQRYKNIYLLPGFKGIDEKNFFDFPEAEEGKYMEKIMDCLKRVANVVLIDTANQFFNGATIDTVKEVETMYFVTTPYLPHRIDTKASTKFFTDKKHNGEFKLIISSVSGSEQIDTNMLFEDLKDVQEYTNTGKVLSSMNIFKNYFTVAKVSNMDSIVEDQKYAYEIDALETYKSSIDRLCKDIYYFQQEVTYGKDTKKNRKGVKLSEKLPISKIFHRRNAN